MGNSGKSDNSITVEDATMQSDHLVFLDVRKPLARTASGETIAKSHYCHPFDALRWKGRFAGKRIVVFCVHGHEVSQAVSGYLRDEGMDASYLVGGFGAWRTAGNPCVSIDEVNR